MTESESRGKGIHIISRSAPEAQRGPSIPTDRDLREAVGYCWPVVVAPRVARLIASTDESCGLSDRPDQLRRRMLWLAGIALRDMPPQAREAEFEIMIDGRVAHLAASFDTSEGLAIHIGVVGETEWERGVDLSGYR